MSHLHPGHLSASHSLSVFPAEAFCVTDGVNFSETISDPATLCLGDAYTLRSGEAPETLVVEDLPNTDGQPAFKLTQPDGRSVTRMTLRARLTFITHIGASVDVLVMSCDGPSAQTYLHPLGPLQAQIEYMLIKVSDDVSALPVTDLAGISFSRGTRITMATGAQVAVENLREGDRVLTRDNGGQSIRWIGTRTVQAVGAFAPVVIGHGALGNAEALIVSQTHRMLMSNWRAEVLTGSKDVLISARDLINDDDIYLRPGGFIEYTQLVFDEHQIIYAEGVATESLQLSPQILSNLPDEAADDILRRFPRLAIEKPQFCRVPLDHAEARNFLRQIGRL